MARPSRVCFYELKRRGKLQDESVEGVGEQKCVLEAWFTKGEKKMKSIFQCERSNLLLMFATVAIHEQ